jgi:hypothetical protein
MSNNKILGYSHRDGWLTEINDFLRTESDSDWGTEREAQGFSPAPGLQVGDNIVGSFNVEVFARDFIEGKHSNPEYNYLVEVEVAGRGERIVTETLPDLLALLKEVIPLSITIDDWFYRGLQNRKDFDEGKFNIPD